MKWSQAVLLTGVVLASRVAVADVTSDRASAIVVYPVIHVSSADSLDAIVQISNISSELVAVRCFYVNANGHCSDTGSVCYSSAGCTEGVCTPGWSEVDFRLFLTAGQPVAWFASEGLSEFPLNGTLRQGPRGQSNAGSLVPAVSEDPFSGELKCVVVDSHDRPVDRNVLVGSATLVQYTGGFLDVTRQNAVGIQAVIGANNGDNTLVLGEEYNGCPQTLIVDHFFDGGLDPVTGVETVGALALAPCSQDFVAQDQNVANIPSQFLVFNEFEQRFSTSLPVRCYALMALSNIDTAQASRSIFHVAVAGTLTGQTRIRGVGDTGRGLIGAYFDLHGNRSSATNLHLQGDSGALDVIRLP